MARQPVTIVMTMVIKHALVVPAGEFKAKCLELMDRVASSRRPVVVTKRGKPVATLVPYEEKPRKLFGYFKGRGEILGDILSPINVEWLA